MKPIKIFTQLALAALLTGCTALRSEYIPGERVDNLQELLPEESIWISDDRTVLTLRISGSNELVLTGLDWNGKTGKYEEHTLTVVLSKIDEQFFASCKEDDDPYIITRLIFPSRDDGRLCSAVILNIDEAKLKEDAAAGKVALQEREQNGKTVFETVLTGTKAEQDEYFRSNPNSLWDLDSASVIRRAAP